MFSFCTSSHIITVKLSAVQMFKVSKWEKGEFQHLESVDVFLFLFSGNYCFCAVEGVNFRVVKYNFGCIG